MDQPTSLTSGSSTTDASSYVTASITPPADALILLAVENSKASAPDTPTASGCSLTWVQVKTEVWGGVTPGRLTVFRAMGSAPTAGAVTIDFAGATQTGCSWSIVAQVGAHLGGTNGSSAVVQSVAENTGVSSVTSLTVDLAAFSSDENATYGVFAHAAAEGTTQGSGFTEIHDVSRTTPSVGFFVEWKRFNDQTVFASWSTSAPCVGIAIEIAPEPSASLAAPGAARRSVYERTVRADSPNAWWRFKEGGELDEEIVGSALALTKNGTIVQSDSLLVDAVAAVEKSRTFEGALDYYTAADHAALDVGDSFSLEVWVRRAETTDRHDLIAKDGSYRLRIDNSTLGNFLVLSKPGVGDVAKSTIALVAGTVYHCVVTKNGSTRAVYVNGADVTNSLTNQTFADTANNLYVGANFVGSFSLEGELGEVAIYDHALSADRVLAHYQAGSAPFEKVADDATHFPKQRLEIGFESGPKTEFPKTSVVTDRLRSWSISRGRSNEFSQVDTSSWEGVLDNRDRALESGHDGSPYFPNVKQTKQLIHTAHWNGVQYDLFRGVISDYGPTWTADNADAVAHVKAHDWQKLANLEDLTGALSQQASGARIGAVLTTGGFPAGMRDIDAGAIDVVAVANAEGTNQLAHVQDTAKADPGIVFVDKSGWWVFQDRNHRIANEATTRATFGDDPLGVELPYRAIRARDDDADVWNDVRVTVAGTGNVRTASDSTSQTDHGKRSKSESLALVTDAQGDAVASYWLALYKDAKRRIPEIESVGAGSPMLLWPVLLGAEISWRVATLRRPPGGGDPILIEQHVEGVRMSAGLATWTTTLTLSPADTASYWELGIVGKSELGETTWLYV